MKLSPSVRRFVVVAALGLALGGCATVDKSGSDQPLDHLHETDNITVTEPTLTYPPSLRVDANDPTSVGLGAVRIIYGWRIGADASTADAVDRATPLLSAPLANRFALIRPEPTVRPQTWSRWQHDKATARVAARLAPEEHPADTAVQWQRKVAVEITVTDPGGRRLWHRLFAVRVTAQKQAGAWLISAFTPLGV